jgi:hypothetical protein
MTLHLMTGTAVHICRHWHFVAIANIRPAAEFAAKAASLQLLPLPPPNSLM